MASAQGKMLVLLCAPPRKSAALTRSSASCGLPSTSVKGGHTSETSLSGAAKALAVQAPSTATSTSSWDSNRMRIETDLLRSHGNVAAARDCDQKSHARDQLALHHDTVRHRCYAGDERKVRSAKREARFAKLVTMSLACGRARLAVSEFASYLIDQGPHEREIDPFWIGVAALGTPRSAGSSQVPRDAPADRRRGARDDERQLTAARAIRRPSAFLARSAE